MREIALSSSLLVYIDDLEYTEAALAAHPDTAALVGPHREKIESWSAIFAEQRAARREINRAEALVSVRNEQIDGLTSELGGEAYVAAHRDRKSVAFRRFFPVAPSELIRQGLRRQSERTRDVIVPELAKLDADNPLRRFAEPLGKAVDAAIASLDARAQRKGDAAQVMHAVEEWKAGVNLLRRMTHAELAKLAAEKGYPKSWPESFFRSESRAAADEEPTATEAPPSAE